MIERVRVQRGWVNLDKCFVCVLSSTGQVIWNLVSSEICKCKGYGPNKRCEIISQLASCDDIFGTSRSFGFDRTESLDTLENVFGITQLLEKFPFKSSLYGICWRRQECTAHDVTQCPACQPIFFIDMGNLETLWGENEFRMIDEVELDAIALELAPNTKANAHTCMTSWLNLNTTTCLSLW